MNPHLSGLLVGAGGVMTLYWLIWEASEWRKHRRKKHHIERTAVVDYMEACAIANRYIDPDGTMKNSLRLTVRSQVLDRFNDVVGAKIGDDYNGELLHQWLQKNAARSLVKNLADLR